MRKYLIGAAVVLALATGVSWWYFHHSKNSRLVSHKPAVSAPIAPNGHTTKQGFNKQQYSLTDPTSTWVIVNKQHPLNPVSYIPADLRFPNVSLGSPGADNMYLRNLAATGVEEMFAAADQAGYKLKVVSGYRSYSYQVSVYGQYVSSVGQAAADNESARPGYSEHQTGLALDIGSQNGSCTLSACFGDTPEGKWLVANAYQYGFILRYPADKTAITGYMYEPWHFRYVGKDLATEMHIQNIQTLEEFFNVSGGTSY